MVVPKSRDVIDLSMRGWSLINRGVQQSEAEHRESNHEARALFDRGAPFRCTRTTPVLWREAPRPDSLDYFNGWGDPGTDYEAKLLGQANQAIEDDPNNPYVYYPKALYLALSGRPREAVDATDAGLAVDQNFVLLYLPRAIAENSLGRFDQAKADAETGDAEAEPPRPRHRHFIRRRGRCRARPGSYRRGDRRLSQGNRLRAYTCSSSTPTWPPPTRMPARWTRRGRGFGRSSPFELENHGQMDEGTFA